MLVTFVLWMGSRATAVALPLVALDQTGQEWTTGLVLGAQALPLVTVPWWGRSLRERVSTGRRVAAVMLVQALGLAVVPVAAALHRLGPFSLVSCGLVVGAAAALEGPGVRALLSDLGDDLGAGRAAWALTLQDLAHRCTMFLAPPLAAVAVGHGHVLTLLWAECAAVMAGAAVLAVLPHPRGPGAHVGDLAREARGTSPGPGTLRGTLAAHPRLTASMLVHAVVSATWFAFGLGLAIAGAQTHRPGAVIAAGMAGYGLASTLTSLVAPVVVNRIPTWPTAVLPTAVLGGVFVVLPQHLGSLTSITVLAAAGGLVMPLGIAAHNRLLATEPAPGSPRRAAFTADQVADGGASAVGMLLGGAVIGALGVPATFVVAGAAQILAVLAAVASRPAPTASGGATRAGRPATRR